MSLPRAVSDHLLRTLAAVPPTARVLDLGCGDGRHTLPLAQLGFDVWACDEDRDRVARARSLLAPVLDVVEAERRVTAARPDALGYPDAHFDWIVACGAYDGAADAGQLLDLLAETMRVLRPGGWVFAAMTAAETAPESTPETLARLFAEAGLALAEEPAFEADMVRGIFRRMEEGVAA